MQARVWWPHPWVKVRVRVRHRHPHPRSVGRAQVGPCEASAHHPLSGSALRGLAGGFARVPTSRLGEAGKVCAGGPVFQGAVCRSLDWADLQRRHGGASSRGRGFWGP